MFAGFLSAVRLELRVQMPHCLTTVTLFTIVCELTAIIIILRMLELPWLIQWDVLESERLSLPAAVQPALLTWVSAEIRFWFILFSRFSSLKHYLGLVSVVLCEATKWVTILNWLNVVLKANCLWRKVQSSLKDC